MQLTAESLDNTLPSISFGDGDDVGHVAFFERINEGVFLAQVLFRPVELIVHGTTCQSHFHHVRNLGRDTGEGVRLCGDNETNFAKVGLHEVLHVLVGIVLLSLRDTLEKFREGVRDLVGFCPDLATGLHAVGSHFVASNAENAHFWAFDDRDRNSNFLAGRGTSGVKITSQNVGHTSFPAGKSLHSDFARIGCGPRLDVTKWAVRSLARAERH